MGHNSARDIAVRRASVAFHLSSRVAQDTTQILRDARRTPGAGTSRRNAAATRALPSGRPAIRPAAQDARVYPFTGAPASPAPDRPPRTAARSARPELSLRPCGTASLITTCRRPMDDLRPLISQPSVDAVPGQAVVHPSAGPVGRARASLRALEALDRITGQGAEPTPDDLVALQGWAGWGPMAPAFSPARRGSWQEIGERLEWLLPPGQLREAEQATPNAFYTPPGLAAGCWQILRGLGFGGGRILEPGCGAGAFLAAAPADIEAAWVGVERDPVTARIAQLLHPAAQIINEPLQNAALPAHSMDAVIGNVPFSEAPVYDPTAPKDVARSLHNYCIWRSVRCLRPGGVAVLITSRYTMDARDDGARRAIAVEADLVGAIRLPGDALASGGTEVVADILVLRRRSRDGSRQRAGLDRGDQAPRRLPGPGVGLRRPRQPVVHRSSRAWSWARCALTARPGTGGRCGSTGQMTAASLPAALAQATTALVSSASEAGLTWQPARRPFF